MPDTEIPDDHPSPGHDPLIGSVVDGMTLVRRIGEGGFGVVYEGRRAAPPHTVAVKVMRPHVASPDLVRRFEYEATLLVRLEHPAIARVLGTGRCPVAGATVPYIVIEYVAGARPITTYVRAHEIPIRARLEMFLEVCDAIAHGHQRGVLHRDIKPGNILVDSDGRPKVIDYGWARGPDSETVLASARTFVGQLIGTHQYMSPEQFEADPATVDLRSDVYALGAVLQEMLTGSPPHPLVGVPLFEAARIVRTVPPAALPKGTRGIDRQVRSIVARCLMKERHRRYSSATELSTDLRRHLAGEAIAPTSPRLRDSVGFLARRHAAATTAFAVSLASLIAATIAIGWYSLMTEAARRSEAAVSARLRAETLRASAEATRADKEAHDARTRLYVANLQRLSAPSDAMDVAPYEDLFTTTAALRPQPLRGGSVSGSPDELPVELRCLLPSIEHPIASLDWDAPPSAIRSIAFDADGAHVAVGRGTQVGLWATPDGSLVALLPHDHIVSRVAFRPGGDMLATAGRDGAVRFWDAKTGAPHGDPLNGDAAVTDIAFDPAGDRLAVALADGALRVFRVDDGTLLASSSPHRLRVTSLAFSPDGSLLASASADGTTLLSDSRSGASVESFPSSLERSESVAFSPGGDLVACAERNHRIRLWSMATRRSLILVGHTSHVGRFHFSPDGKRLASVAHDDTAIVWDTTTGRRTATLHGHLANLNDLAFSPDGTILATVSSDRTMRLWDAATGEPRRVLKGHRGRIDVVAWSPDGQTIVTGDHVGTALVWDGRSAEGPGTMHGHAGPVVGLASVGHSGRLASWSKDGTARLWDGTTATELFRFGRDRSPVSVFAASRDGRLAAIGGDDLVLLHDLTDGRVVHTLRGHSRRVTTADFNPGGSLVATGSADGDVRVWNTASGNLVRTLLGHHPAIEAVRFDSDGRRLVIVGTDGRASILAVDGDSVPVTLDVAQGPGFVSAVSHDGDLLAVGDERGLIRLWNLRQQAAPKVIRNEGHAVRRMAFDPTGSRLVVADNGRECTLFVTIGEGDPLRLVGHSLAVRAMAFHPDGSRLATASADRTVRLWDCPSGQPLTVLRGHRGPVHAIAFSADGRDLASASADGTIRVWSRTDAEIHARRRAMASGNEPADLAGTQPTLESSRR